MRSARAEAWMARLGVFVASIALLRIGFELWWVGRIHEHAWVQAAVAFHYAAGVALLVLSLAKVDHRRLASWGLFAVLGSLALYAAASMTIISVRYTADALLLVHQATHVFLQGGNPYAVDLAAGYEGLSVPYYVQTPTTSGGIVTNLNYPALSFLVYAPFVAGGLLDLRPVNAAFLMALAVVIHLAVPRHLRLLLVSCLLLSSFFLSFSVSGFDIVFVFLLALAVVLWQKRPWAAMFFFGLACAVKQTGWFIAPFLILRLWLERPGLPARERAVEVARAAWWAVVAFLLPNALFLAADPVSWWHGVMTPLGFGTDTLVPLSQGVTVFVYTGLVDVDPFLLHMLAGSALVGALLLYWARFERFRDAAWGVPAVVLMFTERSLQNYFEMFYPIVLIVLAQAWGAQRGDEEAGAAAPGGVAG